jgi:hypothetical protein
MTGMDRLDFFIRPSGFPCVQPARIFVVPLSPSALPVRNGRMPTESNQSSFQADAYRAGFPRP